jgi:aldose 1-epimerase
MTSFGQTPGGRAAQLYRLENGTGFAAEIADYGGTIVRLFAPDRQGKFADVVLGFDAVEAYVARSPFFGCIVGRYGNRIAGGKFSLEGRDYQLACNNQPGGVPCHLHGGIRGFDKVMWQAEKLSSAAGEALRLEYRSADGEEGYPGNLDVEVTYTVTPDNALRIDYTARIDRPCPVNLTNHSYFNLAGEGAGDVLGHVVTLNASRYTPVNAGLVPTGEIALVAGTPLDFTVPHPIGERIERPHEQLRFAGGYDHNFVLDAGGGAPDVRRTAELALAATVLEPQSGRILEVLTTEPGVQFYTGNFLDGSLAGKGGHIYPRRGGLCLETQHFPDSPNQPAFPSTILQPGDTLRSTTVYRFSAR